MGFIYVPGSGGGGGGDDCSPLAWTDPLSLSASAFVPDVANPAAAGTFASGSEEFKHVDYLEFSAGNDETIILGKKIMIPVNVTTGAVKIKLEISSPSTNGAQSSEFDVNIAGFNDGDGDAVTAPGGSSGATITTVNNAGAGIIQLTALAGVAGMSGFSLMGIRIKRTGTTDSLADVVRLRAAHIQFALDKAVSGELT